MLVVSVSTGSMLYVCTHLSHGDVFNILHENDLS